MQDIRGGEIIEVETVFGYRTHKPIVQIKCSNPPFILQLSPEDARALALNIFNASEAAVSDAFLINWLREVMGIDEPRDLSKVLLSFRGYRDTGAIIVPNNPNPKGEKQDAT